MEPGPKVQNLEPCCKPCDTLVIFSASQPSIRLTLWYHFMKLSEICPPFSTHSPHSDPLCQMLQHFCGCLLPCHHLIHVTIVQQQDDGTHHPCFCHVNDVSPCPHCCCQPCSPAATPAVPLSPMKRWWHLPSTAFVMPQQWAGQPRPLLHPLFLRLPTNDKQTSQDIPHHPCQRANTSNLPTVCHFCYVNNNELGSHVPSPPTPPHLLTNNKQRFCPSPIPHLTTLNRPTAATHSSANWHGVRKQWLMFWWVNWVGG